MCEGNPDSVDHIYHLCTSEFELRHFLFLCQVIPGKEQRSIEALCWVGERLFSAGLSGEIIEFDLHNLRPKLTIDAYGGPIWTITPNPQGTHLAVCVYLYQCH